MKAIRLLKRLARMIFGYLVAVLAASATAGIVIALGVLIERSLDLAQPTLTSDFVSNYILFVFLISMVVVVAAFPFWMLFVVITNWFNFRSRNIHLAGGILAALPLLIMTSTGGGGLMLFSLWCAGLSAGLIGGWVYWDLTVKYYGDWRFNPSIEEF